MIEENYERNARRFSNQDVLQFGRNINEEVKGKIDPVIGRDEEIRKLLKFREKTKNNVILIENQESKTDLEGLAERIVEDDIPSTLKDKTIFELDMGALVAALNIAGNLRNAEQLKQN